MRTLRICLLSLNFSDSAVQGFNDCINKIVQHLKAEGRRYHPSDKIFRVLIRLIFHIFSALILLSVSTFLLVNLSDNNRQVEAVGVNVIIMNNILNIFGNKTEDVYVLVRGKLLDRQGMRHVFDFSGQSFCGNTFNFQSADIEPQISYESL